MNTYDVTIDISMRKYMRVEANDPDEAEIIANETVFDPSHDDKNDEYDQETFDVKMVGE